MEIDQQQTPHDKEFTLESLTNAFLKRFKENNIDIPSASIERWLRDFVPIERYNKLIYNVDSRATEEGKEKYFVSLLLCFAIDFKASIEDAKNAFYDGEDDHLLLLLIIYAELFAAHMSGPSYFAVKHACIIEEYLHEFYNAAKTLLTNQVYTLFSPELNCQLQRVSSTDTSISVILICYILQLLLPQTKVDRFKIYHAKIQHIPYFLIADTTISLNWRCEMVSYIVENRLIWEKDVDSDLFLTNIFKPCLDGMNAIILQLDLHTDAGIIQLLKCMLFIYLLIETYDIDRLFKSLKGPVSSFFNGDSIRNNSYFGFLDVLPVKPAYTIDSNARRALVRTRSVSNLQTHSLNLPSSNQESTVTSFTCFINLLTTCAKLIYTQKDELLANPYAFQEMCRLLFCSVSVLLFSLLTCLGNLSSSAFPLSLATFAYILRCALLFTGVHPLGNSSELEYQAACMLYHLNKIIQCHLNKITHQKLELLGFVGADKLRNIREFLFKPNHLSDSSEYNSMVCTYFGISPAEIDTIMPLSVKYTSDGSLYSSINILNKVQNMELSHFTQQTNNYNLQYLSSLRTQVHSAIQFVIFHVFQYEDTIVEDLFYTKAVSIKIFDPKFSSVIEIISKYLSHEELLINDSLSDLFSTKFIQSIVLLLYACSTQYSRQFFDKNNILYNQRYNFLTIIIKMLLDLLLVFPNEKVLSALLYRPELCLLPSSLLSIFESLSCPKQIHLHMPLLLLVVDLFNEFICRLTRYTKTYDVSSRQSNNDIPKAVMALVSSTGFAESVVKLIKRLITREWASIGRNCSIVVELLLLCLIEFFHLSQKGVTMLVQQRTIATYIINFFKSITIHRQSTTDFKSITKSSTLSSTMGDRSFLMNSRVIEILMSILTFYQPDLISFIKKSHDTDTLQHIIGMFLSNFPRFPYSRCRHLPFFAYVFIYGYANKSLAHIAGSVIWTFANYLLWPSSFLYGFLDTLAILRTCRHSFGFYNLLLHQFIAGVLGRNSLERVYTFPSMLQLKMVSEHRYINFSDMFELEYCTAYANQQEIEPTLCRVFAIEYLFSIFRNQKMLSTWQSVQTLAIPSLSIKDIHSVNLPDALFNIRENEVQTRRSSYIQKFKQFFIRTLCFNNVYNIKKSQSFASVCSLRSHLMYILNKTRNDPLLPLTLLFILLHTTCNLKNCVYEISGWTTAYECIPIFINALHIGESTIQAAITDCSFVVLRNKYLYLIINFLEELLLSGFYSLKVLATTSGALRFIHDSIKSIKENQLPTDYKASSLTAGLSFTRIYSANHSLHLNISAIFVIWTGYLDLLLTFLATENMMEAIKDAAVNPLKLLFVLTILLEHCQLLCSITSTSGFPTQFPSTIFDTCIRTLPLLIKILTDMCTLSNEHEYIDYILSSEYSDVSNFTILKSLAEKSNMDTYQHNKTRGKQHVLLSTPLSVDSFEIGKSHTFICSQLKKYFKDGDVIRWLFKSKWSFSHAVRSSNIAICAKIGLEFYCTRLNNPEFEDFLRNLLYYFHSIYDPISTQSTQLTAYGKKIINHYEIFSKIEIDCPELLGLSNCSLIDLILHLLKVSLSKPSLMKHSVLLLEILSFVSPLSNSICQLNGILTCEDIQMMATVLQLSLQSHDQCEFVKAYMVIYALILNLSTSKEEDNDYTNPNCTMISKSDLSTQYDSILQEDTGLKLLVSDNFMKVQLSPSLIPIAALRFMLDHENWDDDAITLVIALIKFIFAQRQRFNTFLLSKVCFKLLNNLIGSNLIKSRSTRLKIMKTIVENIEVAQLSNCCTSDMNVSVRFNVFVICLHAVIYNFQENIQANTVNDNDGDITRLLLNAIQKLKKLQENIEVYSFIDKMLHDKEEGASDYTHLIRVLTEYRTKCTLLQSSTHLNLHETISIPTQKQHPNQHTFEGLGGESSALLP